jgi:cell division transport system permease protein
MYLSYSLRLAAQNLWREKWINFLSALTIAIGLVMVALTFFAVYNMDLATKKLPERFSMMLYLNDGTSEQDTETIIKTLKETPTVESVRYISKEKALDELKSVLKNADYVLEGINENPLPASIELKLHEEAFAVASVKKFASEIKKIKGIADVEYGEQFLSSLHSIKTGVQALSLLIAVIMFTGIIFVCYSTVKITFYRRKEEMETFKLLGATKGFIRSPFIIEGGVIGLGGGIVSMLITAAFTYAFYHKLANAIPIFKIIVFPSDIFLLLPIAGLALGIAGTLIAIGRIRFC